VAKTAVTELTEHIESIRQEVYKEGYAAAMRAVAEFSTSRPAIPKASATKATASKATTASTAAPPRLRRTQAKTASQQTRRGDNARHIAEAMMTLPNHSGPAAVIKQALAQKGHALAYTSIRHGLGQLQARGEASVGADGKTWSYTAPAS
jgi:hypothetical protein